MSKTNNIDVYRIVKTFGSTPAGLPEYSPGRFKGAPSGSAVLEYSQVSHNPNPEPGVLADYSVTVKKMDVDNKEYLEFVETITEDEYITRMNSDSNYIRI